MGESFPTCEPPLSPPPQSIGPSRRVSRPTLGDLCVSPPRTHITHHRAPPHSWESHKVIIEISLSFFTLDLVIVAFLRVSRESLFQGLALTSPTMAHTGGRRVADPGGSGWQFMCIKAELFYCAIERLKRTICAEKNTPIRFWLCEWPQRS
jgi:hypothetical protein